VGDYIVMYCRYLMKIVAPVQFNNRDMENVRKLAGIACHCLEDHDPDFRREQILESPATEVTRDDRDRFYFSTLPSRTEKDSPDWHRTRRVRMPSLTEMRASLRR
jgi:hypothetical protein